jgi:hypothetical protein
MHFSGQIGTQMSQSMHPAGSTTWVRCCVVKKWIVSVGHAFRQSPQLMHGSSRILTDTA